MIKRKILTVALVAVGAFGAGYKTLAQSGTTMPSPSETTSPSGSTMPSPSETTSPSGTTMPSPSETTSPSGSTMSSPEAKLSSSDKRFMLQAAQGGTAEIQLGQLATQKASSDQVKQFAQQMVDQHSQVNNQLAALAAQKGVTLPTTLSSKYQAAYDKLSKLSGKAFDQAYMSQAGIKSHTQQTELFKRESEQGKDPEVKAFAAQVLPAVEDHLKLARDISSGKTAGASDSTSTPGGSMSTPSGSMSTPSGSMSTPGGSMSTPGGSMSAPGGSMPPSSPVPSP